MYGCTAVDIKCLFTGSVTRTKPQNTSRMILLKQLIHFHLWVKVNVAVSHAHSAESHAVDSWKYARSLSTSTQDAFHVLPGWSRGLWQPLLASNWQQEAGLCSWKITARTRYLEKSFIIWTTQTRGVTAFPCTSSYNQAIPSASIPAIDWRLLFNWLCKKCKVWEVLTAGGSLFDPGG